MAFVGMQEIAELPRLQAELADQAAPLDAAPPLGAPEAGRLARRKIAPGGERREPAGDAVIQAIERVLAVPRRRVHQCVRERRREVAEAGGGMILAGVEHPAARRRHRNDLPRRPVVLHRDRQDRNEARGQKHRRRGERRESRPRGARAEAKDRGHQGHEQQRVGPLRHPQAEEEPGRGEAPPGRPIESRHDRRGRGAVKKQSQPVRLELDGEDQERPETRRQDPGPRRLDRPEQPPRQVPDENAGEGAQNDLRDAQPRGRCPGADQEGQEMDVGRRVAERLARHPAIGDQPLREQRELLKGGGGIERQRHGQEAQRQGQAEPERDHAD